MFNKIFFIALLLAGLVRAQSFFNYELDKISFSGNNAFSTSELKEAVLSTETPWWGWKFLDSFTPWGSPPVFFDSSYISVDILSLKDFYRDRGYFLTKIMYEIAPDTSDKTVELIYKIEENEPFTYGEIRYKDISSIHWRANFDFFNEVVFDSTERYTESDVTRKLLRGIDMLQNNGYMFAGWDSTHVFVDTTLNKVFLDVFITPGKLFLINNFVIEKDGEGKNLVSDILLTDITGISSGENYNKIKIKKSQDRLARTGLFNSVSIEPLVKDTLENRVPLQIKGNIGLMNELSPDLVVDNNQNYFNLGFGANYVQKNFLGRARRLTLRGKVSVFDFINTNISNWFVSPDNRDSTFKGSAEFTAEIEQPYLFNRPIFGNLQLYIKSLYHRESNITTYGGRISFEFEMPEYTFINQLKPYFNIEEVIYTETFKDVYQGRSISLFAEQRALTPVVGVELGSSHTNNFFFPSNGYNLAILLETGAANTRIKFGGPDAGLLAGFDFNENAFFYKSQFTLSSYLALNKNVTRVLAGKLKSGYIQTYSGEMEFIPANKTFFAGGSNSVRGWRARELYPGEVEFFSLDSTESTLGGTFLIEGSLEFRQRFFQDFGTVLFFDFGNTWIGYKKVSFEDFAAAVGIGFRYYSPIAPFRIDFGFKLYDPSSKKTLFKRSVWETLQFHFGIGEAF